MQYNVNNTQEEGAEGHLLKFYRLQAVPSSVVSFSYKFVERRLTYKEMSNDNRNKKTR